MFTNRLVVLFIRNFMKKQHCVISVRIASYSGPYPPAFGLNTDQDNSEYGHFSRSAIKHIKFLEPANAHLDQYMMELFAKMF